MRQRVYPPPPVSAEEMDCGQRLVRSQNINKNEEPMSRELQEKADRIIRELKDSLVPIKEELEILKSSTDEKNTRTLR